MKLDIYAAIHAAMEQKDYHALTKPEKKEALDTWLRSGLDAAVQDPGSFSPWERVYYRDAISYSADGLFLMAYAALYRATMPNTPAYDLAAANADDIAGITLQILSEAANQLRDLPARPHPIFMR